MGQLCHDDMCRAIIPTTRPKSPQHESLETPRHIIDDLRSRLSRRNVLLDTIRKAYHRDVIAVKEHLTHLFSRGILPNNQDVNSFLSSIPSLDVRPALLLFAPNECELELHPCHSCGGQLEIIHRESSRISRYKDAIKLLQEREIDLHCQMVNAEADVKNAEARRNEVIENARLERVVLLDQILALKHQTADKYLLKEELKQTEKEKQQLHEAINRQHEILQDHERLVVDIENVVRERDEMTRKFHSQVNENETLQLQNNNLIQQLEIQKQENQSLRQQVSSSRKQSHSLEEACTTLTTELSKSKEATNEAESCLYKAEKAIDKLEFNLKQIKEQAKVTVNNLESKCANLGETVEKLRETVRLRSDEVSLFRKRIHSTLEGAWRRGSIKSVPKNDDAAFEKIDELICELEICQQKAVSLSNLLLSCIRSAYENCLVQESMLKINRSGLHQNKTMLNSASLTNEKTRMVLKSLDNAHESDTLDWTSSLYNVTDQRHVLGNLQNRLQMGQFSLNKCFEKVRKDAANDMNHCKVSHAKQIDEKMNRIWELEKLLTEAIKVNRKYEEKMIIMRDKHEDAEQILVATQSVMRNLRKNCQTNEDTVAKLRCDFDILYSAVERLLQQLVVARKKIVSLNDAIHKKQGDIDTRDEAMLQLESLLENITHRYAENERQRIKVTCDMAIQAVVSIKEVGSTVDFLPTHLKNVSSDDDNKSKTSCDALLPGRLIQIKDDGNCSLMKNPLWINAKPSSSLHLRRAIDRL